MTADLMPISRELLQTGLQTLVTLGRNFMLTINDLLTVSLKPGNQAYFHTKFRSTLPDDQRAHYVTTFRAFADAVFAWEYPDALATAVEQVGPDATGFETVQLTVQVPNPIAFMVDVIANFVPPLAKLAVYLSPQTQSVDMGYLRSLSWTGAALQ